MLKEIIGDRVQKKMILVGENLARRAIGDLMDRFGLTFEQAGGLLESCIATEVHEQQEKSVYSEGRCPDCKISLAHTAGRTVHVCGQCKKEWPRRPE